MEPARPRSRPPRWTACHRCAPTPSTRSALETSRIAPRTPFVPAGEAERAERCETIFNLQAAGLKTRLAHTFTKHAVIGLSGGLDSTLALLVTVRAFDALGLPALRRPRRVHAGLWHHEPHQVQRRVPCRAPRVDFRTIAIGEAVSRHFADIGHDPSVTDVTYENAQARERTQILMDLSNEVGGFVIGTGDLSELALGWATYNADHMSMYGVNAGVPKTLVRHLVAYAADVFGGETAVTLRDVLDTPVSPELLPPTGDGEIAQRTEDLVGPYELHDFFLYTCCAMGSHRARSTAWRAARSPRPRMAARWRAPRPPPGRRRSCIGCGRSTAASSPSSSSAAACPTAPRSAR